MSTLFLELPLPPTINGGYWKFAGSRRFLTLAAREFKQQVAHIVSQQPIRFGAVRLSLSVTFHYKDRRQNDLSNRIKSLEDALVQAGLMNDDSQIDELHIYRGAIERSGKSLIEIITLGD